MFYAARRWPAVLCTTAVATQPSSLDWDIQISSFRNGPIGTPGLRQGGGLLDEDSMSDLSTPGEGIGNMQTTTGLVCHDAVTVSLTLR